MKKNPTYGKRFILVGIAVLFLLPVIASPARAATKLFEERVQNVTTGPFGGGTMCGVSDTIFFDIIQQKSVVFWDNVRFSFTISEKFQFLDSAGNLIAVTAQTIHSAEGPLGGLPRTVQFTAEVSCTGASATPGNCAIVMEGFTVNPDGTSESHSNVVPFSC